MADILSEIKRYCSAGNFTDQRKFAELLAAYSGLVDGVRAKCEQLDAFLTRGMVAEATKFYNQQHPSLRDQLNELRFPGLQDWLDTADIYGLTIPSPIDDSVLRRLSEASERQQGLQGFLAEFRQIASSKDLQRKTKLARQIHERQPENAQWTKTLHELEEKCKTEVANQAKEAILTHQEDKLQELYEYLTREPWTVPPRSEMLAKISRTLHVWRLEALGRQADAVAAEVDRLYCEDFNANWEMLGKYFQRWDAICAEEQDFVPAETAKAHVEEVRALWDQKSQERRRETEQLEQFEQRRRQLQDVMDNATSCEELEASYHALISVGRGIPAEDEKRYQACIARVRAQVRQRQIFRALGVLIAAVLLGAIAVYAWSAFREARLCNEYVARIKTILADSKREATECDAILTEVENDHPELLTKSAMETIRDAVMQRQQEQHDTRTQAEARIARIQEKMSDYARNHTNIQESLAVLKKMTLTASLQTRVEELEQTIEQRQTAFAAERKKDFRRAQLEAEANLGKLEKAQSEPDVLRVRMKLRETLRQLEELESDLAGDDQEACQKLRHRMQEKLRSEPPSSWEPSSWLLR